MLSLIEKAPELEFKKLIDSENYEILVGYLINVLCQLAKNDKSKLIRSLSLESILKIVERIENLHVAGTEKCCINLFAAAIPGVSSSLFRIIMSDTKLPKNLLVLAIKTLSKFITVSFLKCSHEKQQPNSVYLSGQNLIDTCDNLALRLNFLVDYITSHSDDLAPEVKFEMLIFCEELICKTKFELISRILKPVVKYTAILSSDEISHKNLTAEAQLRIMIIIDNIRDNIQNCDSNTVERLDSTIISYLISLLDNLDNHWTSMLICERESDLAMLCGFLKLLPQASLTTFLEISDKRSLLFRIFVQLSEFCTQQPFLFLTDAKVGYKALETCNEQIYTIEKRLKYLTDKEMKLLTDCCSIIGQQCDWLCLNDTMRNELRQFSIPSNLFITHLVLKGCLKRQDTSPKVSRFGQQAIEFYIDQAQEKYLNLNGSSKQGETISSQDILTVVIAIETLVTLVELHLKINQTKALKIIILKTLLCPLLNWSSSSSRAISEASLSALTRISHLYGLSSIKDLIEANIDYIVDGASQMMENFVLNSEVTNVLAITLKLSSIDSFYYFKDVYERVFKLLGAYHHTERSKTIALLFYRTLSILSEWKEAREINAADPNDIPLGNESSVKSIVYDIDIDRRLKKLDNDMREAQRIRNKIEEEEKEQFTEEEIMEGIKSGHAKKELAAAENETMNEEKEEEEESAKKKEEKLPDVELTEKILTHCINLMSSNYSETKILAMRAAASGFKVLKDEENTLLPLVHKLWTPLVCRLTGDYNLNLEVNLSAFECLISMAESAKDFIKSRTLDSIIPRLCLFLDSQANKSLHQKDYGPYSMTLAYKCQLKILTNLGPLAYHIQLAYQSLWRVVRTTLAYLDSGQVPSLREAARTSLHFMIALDADCVWYFAKQRNLLDNLPFELIYELPE